MEKLVETLVELRVALAEIQENSSTDSKALPQIEAPSLTLPEDRDEGISHCSAETVPSA
jgi:hypothetical protein